MDIRQFYRATNPKISLETMLEQLNQVPIKDFEKYEEIID